MFKLKIAHRIKPYSHLKKTKCLIPCSTFCVQVVPGQLLLEDMVGEQKIDVRVLVKGPISGFTVEQDLEKAKVNVLMKTSKGDTRYSLFRDGENILLKVLKAPRGGLKLNFNNVEKGHSKGEEVLLAHDRSLLPKKCTERLFLGCTKGQNIEGVMWRHDMKEVTPLLYRLSQLVPEIELGGESGGNFELLEVLKKGSFEEGLADIFNAGFESLLLPRANDTDYQGLTACGTEEDGLPLLASLKSLILSAFISVDGLTLQLLPRLPSGFVAGKLIGVDTPFGKVDLEWTKRKLKRMAIWATSDEKISLKFPKNITSYSLSVDREFKEVVRRASSPLRLNKKTGYFFTNFKK